MKTNTNQPIDAENIEGNIDEAIEDLIDSIQSIALGSIMIRGTEIVVTDPCYEPGTNWEHRHQVLLENVVRGKWAAFVGKSADGINCVLSLIHEKSAGDIDFDGDWEEAGTISVDSGQAGIFDASAYARHFGCDPFFYEDCCSLTLKDADAGVLSFGAVSRTAFGDGAYDVFVKRNASGRIAAIEVSFVGGIGVTIYAATKSK